MNPQQHNQALYATAHHWHWQLRMSERRTLLLAADTLVVSAAVLLSLWIWSVRGGTAFSGSYMLGQAYWLPLLSGIWLVTALLNRFYSPLVVARPSATARVLGQLVLTLLLVYLVAYFFSSPGSLPRSFILYFIASSSVMLLVWRSIYVSYFGRGPFQRRSIVVGSADVSKSIAGMVDQHAGPYYRIVGYVDDNPDSDGASLSRLGSTGDLPHIARTLDASEVIVTSMNTSDEGFIRSLLDCHEQGVEVTSMPAIYEELTTRIPLAMVAEGWFDVLPLRHPGTGVFFPIVKRVFDICMSSLGLLALALVLPFVALAIRLDSPGPIFYIQDRVGKGRRIIRVRKLRSMTVNAEAGGQAIWAKQSDPRITRIGRLLRKTHLDEFPQLLSVLTGDMSIVGPRPERPELVVELEKEIPFYRLRHSVRPGCAGWALVNQGYSGSLDDARVKLEYDLYYIKHQSLWMDLAIVLRAVTEVLSLRGR